VSTAPAASSVRGPTPIAAPASAVPAAAIATLMPASETNTCARARGGE
jgi:hypothetical protein